MDTSQLATARGISGSRGVPILLLCVLAVAPIANHAVADTFYWTPTANHSGATPPSSHAWKSFDASSNWAAGANPSAGNPDSRVPGENDYFFYGKVSDFTGKVACMDMGGDRTVKGLLGGTTQWVPYLLLLQNGSLTFTESFTNNSTHVHVYDGGGFTLGANCASRCGSSNMYTLLHAHDGGELDVGGAVSIHLFRMIVDSGATATLHPSEFAFASSANKENGMSFVSNKGVLDVPDGLVISGYAGVRPCTFLLEQSDGVLNLGGALAMTDYGDHAEFLLGGGTVNATGDVSFSNFNSVMMTNDAVATVNVAAGKTLDLTSMTFLQGTALTKTGSGKLVLGSSVPDAINIEGGVVEPSAAVAFGTVSFAEGGTLHIGLLGVTAQKVVGAGVASITVAAGLLAQSKPIFSVADEDAASALAQKITAPEGMSVVANGGTLTIEKAHEPAGFVWQKQGNAGYWSFYDASYWGVGTTSDAANEDGLIPGEGDVLNYGFIYNQYFCFDMEGGTRWIKGLGTSVGNTYAPVNIKVRNGTLGIRADFTNIHAVVTVGSAGRFVLGENCGAKMGRGGASSDCTVKSGGECVIGGDICISLVKMAVKDGGRLVFRPSSLVYDTANGSLNSSIVNSGSLEFPGGLALSGASTGGYSLRIEQRAGEMVLGGGVTMADTVDHLDFILAGGTVNVTNDAAFIGCRTVMMTNDAVAEVSVGSGKTANFTSMSFESGARLSKTGAGSLILGDTAPSSLSVEAGRLVVGGATAFGSGLSLGEGSVMHFAADGASASAIAGVTDAEFTVEAGLLRRGTVLMRSADAELLNAILQKLSAYAADLSSLRRALVVKPDENAPDMYCLTVVSTCGLVISVK